MIPVSDRQFIITERGTVMVWPRAEGAAILCRRVPRLSSEITQSWPDRHSVGRPPARSAVTDRSLSQDHCTLNL